MQILPMPFSRKLLSYIYVLYLYSSNEDDITEIPVPYERKRMASPNWHLKDATTLMVAQQALDSIYIEASSLR